MKKIFTFFLALIVGAGIMYAAVKIDDLYYNLDDANKTAEVTYEKYMTSMNYLNLKTTDIPSSVMYNSVKYNVTAIGREAFKSCFTLESVIIPNSIITIGDQAFYGCTALKDLVIGISVTTIGRTAFYGCSSLESVTIPHGVTSISDNTFSHCSALASVDIPNTVTSIGSEAFGSCSALTSIEIPNSVTSIGGSAFSDCSGLTSVTLPKGLTIIGVYLFSGCSKLTCITIPYGVTTIGNQAFKNCTSLTSITIPYNVTSILDQAFYGCSGLTSITSEAATPPTCGSSVFYNVKNTTPIYVPANSVKTYKSADVWKNFKNIAAIQSTNPILELEPVETEPGKETAITFTLDGASSSAVLLNLQADDSYDDQKQCVVLRTTLDDAYVATLMDYILQGVGDFGSVFSGVSFFLPAGKGEVKLDFRTYGLQLSVHIGNSGVAHLTQNERGEAVVNYDIKEPTLVCIHASVPAAGAPASLRAPKQAQVDETSVELHSIKIQPEATATGVDKVQGGNAQYTKVLLGGQIYLLRDGKTYTVQGQEVK